NEKYGSVDHAEEVIGRPLWNRDGHLTGPPDNELSADGSHRVAVAAYRQFVDDYMGRRYGEVKQLVRRLGCRPLLSATREYGVNVGQNPLPPDLENQARLYRNMVEMARRSHAAGCFAWWYPGGWRVDERSDFGIVNPDSTLRPAAEVIRQFKPRVEPPRPW